jgi:hypothetical protein
LDGFRALAYVEGGTCRLVSRNRNAFKTFEPLAQAIGQELSGRSAILDGEIVRPGPDGRPMFYELMRRRGPFGWVRLHRLQHIEIRRRKDRAGRGRRGHRVSSRPEGNKEIFLKTASDNLSRPEGPIQSLPSKRKPIREARKP